MWGDGENPLPGIKLCDKNEKGLSHGAITVRRVLAPCYLR